MPDFEAPILHRAHAALQSNPHLSGRNLFIENRDGRLVLRGNVDNFYQKQIAQETIRSIDSEVGIDNEIVVRIQQNAG